MLAPSLTVSNKQLIIHCSVNILQSENQIILRSKLCTAANFKIKFCEWA